MSESPKAERKTFIQSVKPFFTRPALVMILLGFSSGLPLSLIFDTLSVWLRTADLSLTTISYFSLVTFVYSLKFVWAPVLDRVGLPGLTRMLGHRRSWILLSQAVIMLGLWAISTMNPQTQLGLMAIAAIVIGFAGATQDIVIDAWRIETAGESDDRQAIMATATAWGARIAPFVSGVIPLLIADEEKGLGWGWGVAYAIMAALMILGIIGVLLAPKEGEHRVRPIDYGNAVANPSLELVEWVARLAVMAVGICLIGCGLTANIDLFKWLFPSPEAFDAAKGLWTSKALGVFIQVPAVLTGLGLVGLACIPLRGKLIVSEGEKPGADRRLTRPGAYLKQTFIVPVAAFFERYENLAWLMFATICVYRVSDFLLNVNGAFYVDLGYNLAIIAEVRKIFGVIMTMLGVALGGIVMARFGMKTALIFGAVVGSFSNLAYAWLATQGNDMVHLTMPWGSVWEFPVAFSVALGIDNASGGVAGTVLIAYMSSLISKGYAAQQYALFTSLYALPGKLLASQSGRIVESSAKAADNGGFSLKSWFGALPEAAYAKPAQVMGVTREALGTGYIVFFTYSSLIGIAAIALSLWLITVQRQKDDTDGDGVKGS
ncbi:major facilitator transporter [Asticcacaulis biprosthecium C19]|uniref:Major facilitator transporter n=1 Tax=Asticcacaulis biprosthecium C19 TaxID=715226 RepID=F4QK36_9CAUL|nr:MFS transporter [Asticcacaulis biprosthecium]EGF92063.1 major facilitator transporter [Asticcacaulis biprosthecium C19]